MIRVLLSLLLVTGLIGGAAFSIQGIGTSPITADLETTPVHSWFDAADDPAIWVHPKDPSKSRILGSDKQKGIEVYDLDGKRIFSYSFGKINNIDVRYDFPLGNKTVDIVGGTNRTNWDISIYQIDDTGRLKNINGKPIKTTMPEMYGFGFYHSKKTGKYYALVTGKKGEFEQYELFDNGKGQIEGILVRSLQFASQTEGVVADDEYGVIYVAEERGSVYKFDAEPGDDHLTKIASAGDGNLTGDIEGMTIYYTSKGKGYLLISSQDDNTFVVYERTGENKYIGSFNIANGRNTDGTEDTDGIDVIGFNLGPKWPNGFFIAQDGFNFWDIFFRQNFKVVSWDKIADALHLEIDNSVNPRELISR